MGKLQSFAQFYGKLPILQKAVHLAAASQLQNCEMLGLLIGVVNQILVNQYSIR